MGVGGETSNHTPVVKKTKQKEKPTGLEITKILGCIEKKTTTVARSDQKRRFLGDSSSGWGSRGRRRAGCD